jgi:zinc protease
MMLRSAQTLTFILILFVSALTAQTPALPTGVERVATVEAITEYRLANGLRAVLVPDQSKSTTTVNITYLAGSRHENYGEAGMAHIVEHLVSYGSPKHPDAKKEQQERGAAMRRRPWIERITTRRFRLQMRTWNGRSIWRPIA